MAIIGGDGVAESKFGGNAFVLLKKTLSASVQERAVASCHRERGRAWWERGRYAPELFAYAVRDEDMRVLDLANGAAATGVDANELANADKGALGGYDRDGAVYYSFPRAAPLPLLSEL